MPQALLIRVGIMGRVGGYRVVGGASYGRYAQVVVRTPRGLEIGEVLSDPLIRVEYEGTVVRAMTAEDRWLAARLERNRIDSLAACASLLARRNLPATLIDVEHLFDGQSVYFYFLGGLPECAESLTRELAQAYDARVRFREFAEALVEGCGPGCGTATGEGSHCAGCGVECAVAGACGTGKRRIP